MMRKSDTLFLVILIVVIMNVTGTLIFTESIAPYDVENIFFMPLIMAMLTVPLLWYYIVFRLGLKIFSLLFLVNSLLLILIPNILPGVFLYMGKDDISSYIGMIIDITKDEKIPNYNPYPLTFLLSYMYLRITNVDVYFAVKVLTIIYYAFFLLTITTLTRIITRSEISPFLLGFTFIHMAWYLPSGLYPQFIAIIQLLALMYFILKDMIVKRRDELSNTLPEVLILTAMIFTHPFSASYIITLILATFFIIFVKRKISSEEANVRRAITKTTYLLVITFILYFLWFFNMYLEGRSSPPRYVLEELINRILYFREGIMPIQEDISRSLLGTELLYRGLNVLIDDALLYLLFVISFVNLIKRKKNHRNFLLHGLITWIISYSIFTFMIALTKLHTPYRIIILNPALPLIYIYSIVLLDIYRRSDRTNNLILHTLALILALSYVIGSVSLIPSARISIPFNAIYYSEVSLGEFIGTYVSAQSLVPGYFARIFVPLHRILDSVFGCETTPYIIRRELALSMNNVLSYENNSQVISEASTFLILGKYDVHVYASLNKPEIANSIIEFTWNISKQYDLVYNSGLLYLLKT